MKSPRDLADRMSRQQRPPADSYITRETFTLPLLAAREKAAAYFRTYPKEGYGTEVESWSEAQGQITFTMKRSRTAD